MLLAVHIYIASLVCMTLIYLYAKAMRNDDQHANIRYRLFFVRIFAFTIHGIDLLLGWASCVGSHINEMRLKIITLLSQNIIFKTYVK